MSRGNAHAGSAPAGAADQQALAAVPAFLRELAARAEADRAFAAQLLEAARASGLTAFLTDHAATPEARRSSPGRPARAPTGAATQVAGTSFDPFVKLREGGEQGLRAALAGLDLLALRHLVRTHRLDPNRISARWSAHERLVALIVDQVRARADHGKAFARV